MKRHFSFVGMTSFILAFSLLFNAFGVIANAKPKSFDKEISAQTLSAISERLSKELKAELADNSAVVQISDVEKRQTTKTSIDLSGTAFCVLANENNRLPISFEAKINAQTQTIEDVTYKFVEDNSPQFAPTSVEEILIKELMKQVGKDYKTDSIVLALNDFEVVSATDGKAYAGTGEIKIGEVEWSKIKFDVVLDEDNSATKIKYQIE